MVKRAWPCCRVNCGVKMIEKPVFFFFQPDGIIVSNRFSLSHWLAIKFKKLYWLRN